METITLILPDDLAARFKTVPEDERNNYAVAILRRGFETNAEQDEEQFNTVDDDLYAAIAEGIAEFEAGKGRPLEDFIAERKAFWKARGYE
jgi:predicted transcriptional regulator